MQRALGNSDWKKDFLIHIHNLYLLHQRDEIVFTENLCPIDFEEYDPDLYPSSESDYDDDDSDELDDMKANEHVANDAQVLYHASMLLKRKIASIQDFGFHGLPWLYLISSLVLLDFRMKRRLILM
jgi:hypothetical protein